MFHNLHPSLRRCWHPVALEQQVPEASPLGVRLLGERWLLARLGGEIVAMRDRCPHRLVPLSAGRIVDDEIECAYHGYRFDSGGKATLIPALGPGAAIPPKACVDTARTTTRFGLVWICLADDPLDDILDDAGYLDPVNDLFTAGPFETRVSAAILTDNFLDSAHFPFLHRNTFGADDDGKPTLRVERDGWRLYQHDRQVVDGAHLAESVDSAAVYDETSIWWMVHAYPLGGDEQQIAAALKLQADVGIEDLWILEQMEDPNIPLDVRAEVHTKADLGCLEYRRMLADLAAST